MKKYFYYLVWFLVVAYRYFKRPHIFGAGVVVESDGKLLLLRHTYGNRHQWRLPGGHLKKNEAPMAGAKRELYEELGLNLPLTPLGQIIVYENYCYKTYNCFSATLHGQQITHDTGEILEYSWWLKDKLPHQLSLLTVEFLKLYSK